MSAISSLKMLGAALAVSVTMAAAPAANAATLTYDFESVVLGPLAGDTLTLSQGGIDVTFSGLGLLIRTLPAAFVAEYGLSHYLSTLGDIEQITVDIGPGFNVTSATILNPLSGKVTGEIDTISGSAFVGAVLADALVSSAEFLTLSGSGLTQLLFDDVGTGFVIGQLVLEGDFITGVPVPAALPLLLVGLGGLGALGLRRKAA